MATFVSVRFFGIKILTTRHENAACNVTEFTCLTYCHYWVKPLLCNVCKNSWSVDERDSRLHSPSFGRQTALNLVDYKVWSVIQQKAYKGWVKNVDKLCSCILTAGDKLNQHVTDMAVRQWRRCLHAVRVSKWKVETYTLHTNWAISLKCCCCIQEHSLLDISAWQCLFIQELHK